MVAVNLFHPLVLLMRYLKELFKWVTGSPYFWAGKSTAFNWFGSIPFGMNAQSINAWFYEGNGMKLMTELYDRFDLVPQGCW